MRQLLDLAFSMKANPAEANSCGSCKDAERGTKLLKILREVQSLLSSQPRRARVQLGLQKILSEAWRSCLLDNLVHKLKCHKSNSHKALNQTLNALLVRKGRLNWPLELPSHAADHALLHVKLCSHIEPQPAESGPRQLHVVLVLGYAN